MTQYQQPSRQADAISMLQIVVRNAEQRAVILANEAEYFRAILAFRVGNSPSPPPMHSLFDSQIGPIKHLFAATKSIKKDIDRAKAAAVYLTGLARQVATLRPGAAVTDPMVKNLFWLAGSFHDHLATLLKNLGELHTRFDQVVRYSIPDHPMPATRGLRDSTLADRFIAEHARQVHRDLARFVVGTNYLSSPYPYVVTPRAFVTRVYEPQIHVEWHRGGDLHNAWLKWHAMQLSRATNLIAMPAEPDAFVAVRMPFWLPDCLELLPILGHELAHTVLHDAHGHMLADSWSTTRPSLLQSVLRRVRDVIRACFTDDIDEANARMYAQEFVADALALARFRESYLYALSTEVFSGANLLGLAQDPHGQHFAVELLERMKAQSRASTGATVNALDDLHGLLIPEHEFDPSHYLNRLLLLVRVGVVGELAARLHDEAMTPASGERWVASQLAGELCESVHDTVELHAASWKYAAAAEPALDVVQRLIREVFGAFDAVFPTTAGSESSFNRAVDEFWLGTDGHSQNPKAIHPSAPVGADYFLWRQRVSGSVIDAAKLDMSRKKSRGASAKRSPPRPVPVILGDHLHDVAWRMRWLASDDVDGTPSESLMKPQLIRLMLDDYAFRNGNPQPLFDLLQSRATLPGAKEPPLPFVNFYKEGHKSTSALDEAIHGDRVFHPAMEIAAFLRYGIPFEDNDLHPKVVPRPDWDRERLLGLQPGTIADMQDEGDLAFARLQQPQWELSFVLGRGGADASDQAAVLARKLECGSAAALLGRYDDAVLHKVSTDKTPVNPTAQNDLQMVQRRLLSPIYPLGMQEVRVNLAEVCAITMFALASPMAWRVFLHWLTHSPEASASRRAGINHTLFLSDGWEQGVLFFSRPNRGGVAPSVDSVLGMLSDVARHPLVGRTETLFTAHVFRLAPGVIFDVSYRFRCRAAPGSNLDAAPLERYLLRGWDKRLPDPLVRTVSGLTDYEVRIRKPSDADSEINRRIRISNAVAEARTRAAREIHTRLNSKEVSGLVDRLITQIAFFRRSDSVRTRG